jgi:hypothetical protein
MGNSYSVSAYTYNDEDIGVDPDTEQKFIPNTKELELFKKEKLDLYKGTWTICFVYGISAFILLTIVLFTDTGREYIYDKYLPAVLTYVIGAIIIIIYLVYSIFNIKPRKLSKVAKKQINCPDYWKYEKVDNLVKDAIIAKAHAEDKLNISTSNLIDYKCVADVNVFGPEDKQIESKNEIYNDSNNSFYKTKEKNTEDKYFVTKNIITGVTDDAKLKKYAKVTGIYTDPLNLSDYSIVDEAATTSIYTSHPIKCNEVYPNFLSSLEANKDSNDLKCKYAKHCKISWSDIDCYENPTS